MLGTVEILKKLWTWYCQEGLLGDRIPIGEQTGYASELLLYWLVRIAYAIGGLFYKPCVLPRDHCRIDLRVYRRLIVAGV